MSNNTQDDINATVQGTVIDFTGSGFDATRAFLPTVVYNGVSYVMLFGGLPFGNNYQIGEATSTDGANWTPYGTDPVISNAASPSWASFREIPASALYVNSTYYLFYNGDNSNLSTDPGYVTGFGLATSTDAVTWSINPLPILSEPNTTGYLDLISAVNFNGQFELFYDNATPTG